LLNKPFEDIWYRQMPHRKMITFVDGSFMVVFVYV
jgi:hypothetical protein